MEFVLNEYHRNIPDEELLSDVKRVAEIVNKNTLSQDEYREHGKFGTTTFRRRFGSWRHVLELCGFTPNANQINASKSGHLYRSISTEDLLLDVRNVAEQLGKVTISSTEYGQYGQFSRDICFRRFDTWNDVLAAAGLEPFVRVSGKRIENEDLFIEIERMWISLGRQPTTTDIVNGVSCYSLNAFSRRFGGWRNALRAFIEWVNSDKEADYETESFVKVSPENNQRKQPSPVEYITTTNQHTTSREIGYRLRFKVMSRDNFKCYYCGRSPATDPAVKLQVDHIHPWSKGGETTMDNLRTSCSECNLGKGDLVLD